MAGPRNQAPQVDCEFDRTSWSRPTRPSRSASRSLSAIDLMTCLYFHDMNLGIPRIRSGRARPLRTVKGHASPALYGVLAKGGYFPEELLTFRKFKSGCKDTPMQVPGVLGNLRQPGAGGLERGPRHGLGLEASGREPAGLLRGGRWNSGGARPGEAIHWPPGTERPTTSAPSWTTTTSRLTA